MSMKTARSIHPLIPALGLLLTAFVWQAGASSARPPAQPTAVATIDIVEVIDQLTERTVREAELDANKNARQDQVNEVIDQFRTLQADLESLSPGTDEYKDKVRQAMEMQAIIKARGEAHGKILSIDRGDMIRDMYNKITDAAARTADREGYDLVLFDDSLFPITEEIPFADVYRSIVTRSVIYRHDSIDITDQVITLLNNEFTAP